LLQVYVDVQQNPSEEADELEKPEEKADEDDPHISRQVSRSVAPAHETFELHTPASQQKP